MMTHRNLFTTYCGKKSVYMLIPVIALIVLVFIFLFPLSPFEGLVKGEPITNFEECIAAGNPAMESYPRQCMADGTTFVEEIEIQPPEEPETETYTGILMHQKAGMNTCDAYYIEISNTSYKIDNSTLGNLDEYVGKEVTVTGDVEDQGGAPLKCLFRYIIWATEISE